ncbi:La-related protein 4-like isoform X2 [Oopsacas minuta]|uniref:La-related protein 4-like isoform X2 n=1 Tax=Oopsacas minuta TaxID=111878 RepID=A0AAV7JBV6_9METZ|nr:La-related protein 4-like isoform X2 [Oopsacas minuta]
MTTIASDNTDSDTICSVRGLTLENGNGDSNSFETEDPIASVNKKTRNIDTHELKLSNFKNAQYDTSNCVAVATEIVTNGIDTSSEELSDRIRKQIEYYFSKENYWNDQYLLSQSDADRFVSIVILATFPAVKHLSTDLDAIRHALRGSVQLEMDPAENKVRPNLKRCILILRDIPEDTSPEEIEALFEGEGVPDVKGRVEFAINSNCYIRFDSEADASSAYQFVINKTYNGKPIYPRIKSASSSLPPSPDMPSPYPTRQFDQYPMYNYPAIPLPYMHPAPVSSWGPIEPILYQGYLKPTLLVPRYIPMPRMFPHKQSEFVGSPVTRNGSLEFNQSSPPNTRHHGNTSVSSEIHGREGGEGRSSRRKTGGKYPPREEKKPERIPTPKMDADSFPPLPTSPGVHTFQFHSPITPQTPVEPTNKTLSDIVRKGPTSVTSSLPRHTAANPPPSLGRGRGRGFLESPGCEVGDRHQEGDTETFKSDVSRPLGRGRKPKSQSTSDTPTQTNQLTDQSRSLSESGDKDISKSEKLSYAQMAQKLPPPPPPPLPEAANYLTASPTPSDSPNPTPSSTQTQGFFKDSSDTYFNSSSNRSTQDSDNKSSQRKHYVRVSNGPISRGVRGYNGSENPKLHRKGGYSNSRTSRERRAVHQDRDSAFRDH